jgi:hypothetical protein
VAEEDEVAAEVQELRALQLEVMEAHLDLRRRQSLSADEAELADLEAEVEEVDEEESGNDPRAQSSAM